MQQWRYEGRNNDDTWVWDQALSPTEAAGFIVMPSGAVALLHQSSPVTVDVKIDGAIIGTLRLVEAPAPAAAKAAGDSVDFHGKGELPISLGGGFTKQ